MKQLVLETRTELAKKPTLFWAAARLWTRDGKQIPLSQLPLKFENVRQPPGADQDYFGGGVKIAGNLYTDTIGAEPADESKPGRLIVDLSGLGATRFTVKIGSDYPPGDEAQRRKVFAVRAHGVEARFINLIEPFENQPVIRSARAVKENEIEVFLKDGRIQRITLDHFDDDAARIRVHFAETDSAGRTLREEE